MNRLLPILLLTAAILLNQDVVNAQNSSLSIIVEGVNASAGKIMLAIFERPDGFPSDPLKAFHLKQLPASKGNQLVSFNGLPPGNYAVALYHDQNDDKQLNTNLFGVPKEGYGFSNNVRPRFSAPSFGDAAFLVDGNRQIKISLHY